MVVFPPTFVVDKKQFQIIFSNNFVACCHFVFSFPLLTWQYYTSPKEWWYEKHKEPVTGVSQHRSFKKLCKIHKKFPNGDMLLIKLHVCSCHWFRRRAGFNRTSHCGYSLNGFWRPKAAFRIKYSCTRIT